MQQEQPALRQAPTSLLFQMIGERDVMIALLQEDLARMRKELDALAEQVAALQATDGEE